jgi:hypothetical protein
MPCSSIQTAAIPNQNRQQERVCSHILEVFFDIGINVSNHARHRYVSDTGHNQNHKHERKYVSSLQIQKTKINKMIHP